MKAQVKKARTAADHVEQIRQLPCCACGLPPRSDPHHLMRGGDRGGNRTSSGRYTIPLCRKHHEEITPHGNPEAVLMARHGIEARALADALWAERGNLDGMMRAVVREHQSARQRLRQKEACL
ncbi:DUF968 domain-containing protein [Azospirillum doebereinerae]|uniref:DUF968 domain-containing protein n=1 Tax=Azospirillum doebereinerae TaxID=92933 RepID=UPI00163BD4A8|nr:DUF968 domain-containing protein [Azospirillum doebereinerae]